MNFLGCRHYNKKIIFFLGLYANISVFLFFLSGGGFSGWFNLVTSSILLNGLNLILLFFILIKKNKEIIHLSMTLVIILLILQLTYLTFGPSDCGDFPGANNLFARLTGGGCNLRGKGMYDINFFDYRIMLSIFGGYGIVYSSIVLHAIHSLFADKLFGRKL